MHFAHAIDDARECITLDELHGVVAAYLCRHDETIRECEKERRAGRMKTKAHERFEAERDADRREYQDGFRAWFQPAMPSLWLTIAQWWST
jgi:hypothetical protein